MVLTPQAKYLDKVQTWIERLDKASLTANGGVMVYRVQNVDAEELAGTLNSIFTGGSSSSSSQRDRVSLAPGSTAAEVTNRRSESNQPETSNNQQGNRPAASARSPSQSAGIDDLKDVNIIADPVNAS